MPYCATCGLATTRRVGTTASVTRRNRLPPGPGRIDVAFTPIGPYSNFTLGKADICSTNCAPLKEPCRIGTWYGSTTFSKCCSQLQGATLIPPEPMLESSASTNSPGPIT